MPRPSSSPAATPRPPQTGPKTYAGKAKSRMNASRHGLRAASAVLPGEDPAEYEQFLTDIIADLSPVASLEAELARRAAAELWRLRRRRRLTAGGAAGDPAAQSRGGADCNRRRRRLWRWGTGA